MASRIQIDAAERIQGAKELTRNTLGRIIDAAFAVATPVARAVTDEDVRRVCEAALVGSRDEGTIDHVRETLQEVIDLRFAPLDLAPAEPQPDAPTDIAALPDYWDERRRKQGKVDKSRCAAELRAALAAEHKHHEYCDNTDELNRALAAVRELEAEAAEYRKGTRVDSARIVELEAQLAQRADSGAEVSERESTAVYGAALKDHLATPYDPDLPVLTKQLNELLAARRGVLAPEQPAFASLAELGQAEVDAFKRGREAERKLAALAATPAPEQQWARDAEEFLKPVAAAYDPAPEQQAAAGWAVTEEDVRRVCDAGEIDYGSIRYDVRTVLQEMLDLRRLTSPAAIEPLSAKQLESLEVCLQHYQDNEDFEMVTAISEVLARFPRPAAPAVKVVDELSAEELAEMLRSELADSPKHLVRVDMLIEKLAARAREVSRGE